MKNIRNLVLRSLLALMVLGLATTAFAQSLPSATDTQKRSEVVRLNKAPISNDVLRVALPKPTKITLDNGLRVLILEDHRFPTVTTQLVVNGAGSLFDPKNRPGLAGMTLALMRQGTTTRNSKQLAEDIEKLGASIGSEGGRGGSQGGSPDAQFAASGLSENFDKWYSIALDVLLHPSFPADELAQLKQRQLLMLRQQRSAPPFLAGERMAKVLYGEHPASVVSATPESINAMSAEETSKFYHERFVPQNAILAIAGDVKATDLVPKLKKWFADWKKTDLKVELPSNPAAQTASKIFLVDRPGSVQTNLLLGNLAIDRRNPDYVALTVLNSVVGGGAAGRLFMNLREEKGYTYGAYSRLEAEQYVGSWIANSEVRSEVTGGAMTEFFNEIRRIGEQPVPADELARNKRAIVARFALSLERPQSILNYALQSEIYGFPADYWDKYPNQVMAVSDADIQRVAKKYLAPGAIQVVAVGDAAKIKTMLDTFGTVAVFNADGLPAAAPAAVGK